MTTRGRGSGAVRIALVALAAVATMPSPTVAEKVTTGDGYRIEHYGPMPPSWAAATRANSRCWEVKREERGFVRKTNNSRERFGRGRLKLDPEISKVARKHTREMIARNLLYHTSSTDLRRRVTFWSTLGENVGVGGTVDSLSTAFMNSPAHRDNILHSTFRHVGVGTVKGLGRLWVTVIFQASDNPGTTLRMPRC